MKWQGEGQVPEKHGVWEAAEFGPGGTMHKNYFQRASI
jgi:hypothetical protein